MTSLVRPILSSIICCIIAFGHAPAWLHVATCEDGCGGVAIATSDVSATGCSHVCCQQTSSATDPTTTEQENSQPVTPVDQHDSDTCVVCQSLASSIGVVSPITTTLAPEFVCEILILGADQDPSVAFFSTAQPRGPPAVA